MAEYISHPTTSALGQQVEYREYLSEGHSPAERRVRVVVSGKTVAIGWASDGVTYAKYAQIVKEGYRAEDRNEG
jgi:hypothetical protein